MFHRSRRSIASQHSIAEWRTQTDWRVRRANKKVPPDKEDFQSSENLTMPGSRHRSVAIGAACLAVVVLRMQRRQRRTSARDRSEAGNRSQHHEDTAQRFPTWKRLGASLGHMLTGCAICCPIEPVPCPVFSDWARVWVICLLAVPCAARLSPCRLQSLQTWKRLGASLCHVRTRCASWCPLEPLPCPVFSDMERLGTSVCDVLTCCAICKFV